MRDVLFFHDKETGVSVGVVVLNQDNLGAEVAYACAFKNPKDRAPNLRTARNIIRGRIANGDQNMYVGKGANGKLSDAFRAHLKAFVRSDSNTPERILRLMERGEGPFVGWYNPRSNQGCV